MLFAIT